MRTLIFTLLLSFISVLGFSQDILVSTSDSIVFSEMTHDYGTIQQGSDGTCTFTFLNKGIRPLVLTMVHAGCGCTVPEWSKEPIPPGGAGSIKVTYDTKRVGNFSKTITVNSNAINSQVVLTVKGNVTPISE